MRARWAVVIAIALVAGACSGSSGGGAPAAPATTAPPLPKVAMFGDSLTVQTMDAMRAEGKAHGLAVTVVGYFGLAPCDLASLVRKAIARHPAALVLAFSGNNITPCMSRNGHKLVGPAYYAAYRHDLDALVALAGAAHVPADIVGPPAFPPDLDVPSREHLNGLYAQLADAHPGARYTQTASALGGAVWQRTLPCLAGETAALGCHAGRIVVRGPTRIHFDEPRTVPCPTGSDVCRYSAGAHRYADAILAGLSGIPGLGEHAAPASAGVPVDTTRDG